MTQWTYRVVEGIHNHPPSLDPSAHNAHRKRTTTQQDLEKTLSKHKALPACEMADIIHDASPAESSFFRQRDIYNDRQRLQEQALGGKTATQAWIGILQQRLRHIVRYNEDHKITAVFWTYPWCEIMWKHFPEVLGLDNTYKTNRFQMYLFQVTGLTDQRSIANFGFGLINTEREEGYEWLCRQLDQFRHELEIPSPSVIITDKETALKNALADTFPDAQQQLCVYHINANVWSKIVTHWKDDVVCGMCQRHMYGSED